ncbi:CsbD domain-containing protein [Balamuthia mandrillaris]
MVTFQLLLCNPWREKPLFSSDCTAIFSLPFNTLPCIFTAFPKRLFKRLGLAFFFPTIITNNPLEEHYSMSNNDFTISKTAGQQDHLIGALKETAGQLLMNERMEAEGAAQKERGRQEIKAAEAVAIGEGAGELAGGMIKEAAGALSGNEALKTEGRAEQLVGDRKLQQNK